MYALVDCNSFYASCERLFRPDLKHTPIVVLSNNDGCVIARTKEAKALGIPMGAPFFKVKDFCTQQGVQVFSSNYALYQDLSNRVMATLEQLAPVVDIYSIDEAFLHLHGLGDLQRYAVRIKTKVYKDVGVPVGVGVGATRTLAKLANHHAKHEGGVCVLDTPDKVTHYLKATKVADVWGVGHKLSARLGALGVHTAYELSVAPRSWLKKHTSVVLERTARELCGEVCLLDADHEHDLVKKNIVCSRSFGSRVTELEHMRQAVCHHMVRAAEKLRKQHSRTAHVAVFFRTGRHNPKEAYMQRYSAHKLIHPASDTHTLVALAGRLCEQAWVDGVRYAKAGVSLSDFTPEHSMQLDLLSALNPNNQRFEQLSSTLDQINHKFGRRTLHLAAEGTEQHWAMQRTHSSPHYTTSLSELPVVS